MKKRLISLGLAAVMALGAMPGALAASSSTIHPAQAIYTGNAYYDAKTDQYVLTEERANQEGGMWFTPTERNDNFTLSMEFYTGHAGHTDSYGGADGIAIAFYADETSGGRLGGFDGCNGYGVEIDTYTNEYDPKYNHIAVIKNTIENHLQIADASGFTEDGKWHQLDLKMRSGTCTVSVDGTQMLQQSGIKPTGHYQIGITASTGGGYNFHAVRNLELSEALWTNSSQWADSELERAQEYGLIPEILENKDMTQPITRLEFAAVSVKTFENVAATKALPAASNPFTDCKDVEMLKAYNAGIAVGTSDNTFEPYALLNREQCASMLTRVFKRSTLPGWSIADDTYYPLTYKKPASFADDAQISGWAKDSVYFMAANGIIAGVGGNKFAPKNATSAQEASHYANATREQALAIAVRMVEKLK